MSTDRDTTRIVRSWLRTGEHESADRVLDAVLDRLDTTPQRRTTWWPARRYPSMNQAMRIALAAAAVVAVALLGIRFLPFQNTGGPSSQSPAQPTASPAWSTFTSERYAYSIAYPADWRVVEQPGSANLAGMQIGSAGTDLIGPPDHFRYGSDDGVIVVSVHELLGGESLADFSDRVSRDAACGSGFGLEETRLDREPAQLRGRECDYWEWIEITAIHGGRGYVLWAVSTTGPAPKDRPINDQFLATFRFTD